MSRTKIILAALSTIWSSLPELLGEDYVKVQENLLHYIEELSKATTSRQAIIQSKIIDVFRPYPSVSEEFSHVMAYIEGGNRPVEIKSESANLLPEALFNALFPTVARVVDVSCPRHVTIETPRFPLVVKFLQGGKNSDLEQLTLFANLSIQVRIEAPGFEILGSPEQETNVPVNKESLPLVFELRPKTLGSSRITLNCSQGGNHVGVVSTEIVVIKASTTPDTATRSSVEMRLESHTMPPDFVLYISYERFQNQPSFTFTLTRSGEVGRTFTSTFISSDPASYANSLYKSLSLITEDIDPVNYTIKKERRQMDPEDVDLSIKQLGWNLWRDLIPPALKELYASERHLWRGKTLLIVSDEPHIPWELVWPYSGSDWSDDAPWCITTRFTRWLRRDDQGNGHDAPLFRKRLRNAACFSARSIDIPSATLEGRVIREIFTKSGLKDLSPSQATRPAFLRLLERDAYDWLHVSAHGTFSIDNPDGHSALWMEDNKTISPSAIVGPQVEAHITRNRPGFFFNVCHGNRQSWSVTRIGGWANRLISAGASFFLSPLWAVSDEAASEFATHFYQSLFNGLTVSEAVLASRLKIKSLGNPSWLAYSVYAHPNMRILHLPQD